jgi:hypothetical protein
LVH